MKLAMLLPFASKLELHGAPVAAGGCTNADDAAKICVVANDSFETIVGAAVGANAGAITDAFATDGSANEFKHRDISPRMQWH